MSGPSRTRPVPLALDGLVLWAASEAVPWAATGGLGDVVGSLPSVLRRQGWDVRRCLPAYGPSLRKVRTREVMRFDLPFVPGLPITVLADDDPPGGVPTYLLACGPLFDRDGIYGDANGAFGDNPYRFAVFQLALRALAARLDRPTSILHLHDWHTGILPALLQLPGQRPPHLTDTRTVFTIHNLQFQGDSPRALLDVLPLPRELWHPELAEHFGVFLPMKAGITAADRVTTVSPSYAREIRRTEGGFGLDGVLRARGGDLRGLLNGIDTESWNPARDPALAAPFSADDPSGRARCQAALRAELGLPASDGQPIVAFIGRLTHEKGVDLVLEALPRLIARGCQVVLLGTGDPGLEEGLRRAAAGFPQAVRSLLRFDVALSRRIYAGADMLLVPSRTEPCGLVQFYGLRYGAVPIVHGVGGLRDTITDGDNGFVFGSASAGALLVAVDRALALFGKPEWRALQTRGMAQDWSWERSARDYAALYREVLSVPAAEPLWPRSLAAAGADRVGAPAKGARRTAAAEPGGPSAARPAAVRLVTHSARSLFAFWDLGPATSGPVELVLEERPGGTFLSTRATLPPHGERWVAARPGRLYRALLRDASGNVLAASNAAATPALGGAPARLSAWVARATRSGAMDSDVLGVRWASLFPGAPPLVRHADGTLQPRSGRSWPSGLAAPAPLALSPGGPEPAPATGGTEGPPQEDLEPESGIVPGTSAAFSRLHRRPRARAAGLGGETGGWLPSSPGLSGPASSPARWRAAAGARR